MILYRPGRWSIAQPCERIVLFRNHSIHGYAQVDLEVVWTIVQNEVPRLLEKFESLLKELGHGE